MKKIQMVDLKSQYESIKDKVAKKIDTIFEETSFINGNAVKKFQKELEGYLDTKHVIPCANGTDALQIAMMGLGLRPGDEVITVDFTFAATVEVIALLGLTPVLVDVDVDTYNMDTEALKKAITPKTKAIVPVHLFGQCAKMQEILKIAKEHHLYIIEDTAQAIGADYIFSQGHRKKAGTIGDIGTTSFFPSKNLGCYGDGGAIFTDNDELARTMRGLVNHGMYKRYYHEVVGINSRLDSIQAAVLSIKLPLLDNYCKARQRAADYYTKGFEGCQAIKTPFTNKNTTHVFHQYTLQINPSIYRDGLHQYLLSKNIPNAIYYPVALHRQKAYRDNRYKEENFKITNDLVKKVLSLPMHTELDNEQQDYIIKNVLDFITQNK